MKHYGASDGCRWETAWSTRDIVFVYDIIEPQWPYTTFIHCTEPLVLHLLTRIFQDVVYFSLLYINTET